MLRMWVYYPVHTFLMLNLCVGGAVSLLIYFHPIAGVEDNDPGKFRLYAGVICLILVVGIAAHAICVEYKLFRKSCPQV